MVYLFEPFELDEESFCLTRAGQRMPLEPKSLRVLLLLLQSGGKLVEKDKILSSVWKDTFVEETTLTRAIALIRKQLGDDPRHPQFIETVPTLGYRFIAKVETRIGGYPLKSTAHEQASEPAQASLPEAMPVAQELPSPQRSMRLKIVSTFASSRLGKTGLIVAIALLAATFGAAIAAWRYETVEPPLLRYTLQMPEGASLASFWAAPAISPDGQYVVLAAQISGKRGLWLRGLNELKAHLLMGTDDAKVPFWSPDSRWIAFFQNGNINKIRVDGGPVVTVCPFPGSEANGGDWSEEGLIVFGGTPGLSLVPAAGGTPKLLVPLDWSAREAALRAPWFLPDGRHFLFEAGNADRQKTRVYVDSIEARPGSNTRREVLEVASNASYLPRSRPGLAGRNQGYLLFARDATLMAQPFDASAMRTTGEAAPIAEGVDYAENISHSFFSASRSGILVYTSGAGIATEEQLTWFDRAGKASGTVGSPGNLGWVSISPDGSKVAIDRRAPLSDSANIWLNDLARGTESRFTFGPSRNVFPVWSPDGSKIAFRSDRNGHFGPWQKASSGAGEEEVLDKDTRSHWVTDWSRDGRYLIEEVTDKKTGLDIWVAPTSGIGRPFPYIATDALEWHGKLSPDGQFLAYNSDESKRSEVYVGTFPEHGGKWQISTGGGSTPVWSRDGRELYFISAEYKMMAVAVRGERSTLEVGTPTPLFLLRGENASHNQDADYDVSKDGHFLIHVPQAQATAGIPLTVVVNWQSALKK